jgi:hypothetical protein
MTEDQFDKLSAQIYATQVLAVTLAKLSESQEQLRQQYLRERDILETALLSLAISENRVDAIRHELKNLEGLIWGTAS